MAASRLLYEQAELAMAAYAALSEGFTVDQQGKLVDQGFSQRQAEEFAARYTEVLTQFTDTETGFSATVFKDTAGNLTLAIRGTESIFGLDGLPDASILTQGAGYDQIVALHNWWLRITCTAWAVAMSSTASRAMTFSTAGMGIYGSTLSRQNRMSIWNERPVSHSG